MSRLRCVFVDIITNILAGSVSPGLDAPRVAGVKESSLKITSYIKRVR